MTPIDLPKKYSDYYTASENAEIVSFEKANYISVLGNGSPGTNIFYDKKKSLKNFCSNLQFHFKETEKAFKNDIIEIFYWFDEEVGFVNIGDFYTTIDLEQLHYRIAIRIPDFITKDDIRYVAENSSDPYSSQYELFTHNSGKCVQIMHFGPFAGELETLPILQNFATENGLRKSGMHHEIHITHFEKGQSQTNLKTILRDSVTIIQ